MNISTKLLSIPLQTVAEQRMWEALEDIDASFASSPPGIDWGCNGKFLSSYNLCLEFNDINQFIFLKRRKWTLLLLLLLLPDVPIVLWQCGFPLLSSAAMLGQRTIFPLLLLQAFLHLVGQKILQPSLRQSALAMLSLLPPYLLLLYLLLVHRFFTLLLFTFWLYTSALYFCISYLWSIFFALINWYWIMWMETGTQQSINQGTEGFTISSDHIYYIAFDRL